VLGGEDALPDDLRGAVVILCAHGVPPEIEAALAERGARIVDASCPMVKKSQRKAAELGREKVVFLAGERAHSEVLGIKGYNPALIIVQNEDEAEACAEDLFQTQPDAQTALLAQTTISAAEFTSISNAIKKKFPALDVHNTICGATASRQEALRELCKKVDAVIIAGDPNSSNARRLLAIAQAEGKPAWLVESFSSSFPPEIFSSNFKTVGLSAGASTPDSVIEEIRGALEQEK
jgi:4-hydroxy-3-methylbut-2-enyl diphosphate reductase